MCHDPCTIITTTDPDEAYLEATLVSVQGDHVVVDTKGGKVRHDEMSRVDCRMDPATSSRVMS